MQHGSYVMTSGKIFSRPALPLSEKVHEIAESSFKVSYFLLALIT